MDLRSKERLSDLVKERCLSKGGLRPYAREIGASLGAVQGWVEGRTVPSTTYLIKIAADLGYELEELLSLIGEVKTVQAPCTSTSEQILRLMRPLPREELAKIIEAGVRMLATG